MSLESKRARLHDRAEQLARAREFFRLRGVLEVDVPFISPTSSVDAHIDPIEVKTLGKEAFLHTSPEYRMKRLLAEGVGDIYQLGHVFRDGEVGARHNIEFTMAEWYRVGVGFHDFIDETMAFISLFIDTDGYEILSYKNALQQYVGIDPFSCADSELQKYSIPLFSSRDDHLNYILGTKVEPHLGAGKKCTVLAYYPPTQAALAKVTEKEGNLVAERFEVYFHGVELANGYHELQDAVEQEKRLHEANEERVKMGKRPLPIDMKFLTGLKKGLPETCGVAVGFDRLLMLRHGAKTLSEILPFDWEDA